MKTVAEVQNKERVWCEDLPNVGELFICEAIWYAYSTCGECSKHGPDTIVAFRTNDDKHGDPLYNFTVKGQNYLHQRLGRILRWELVSLKDRRYV